MFPSTRSNRNSWIKIRELDKELDKIELKSNKELDKILDFFKSVFLSKLIIGIYYKVIVVHTHSYNI